MHARNGFRRKIFLSFPQASTDHVHTMLSNFRERLPLQRDGMIRDVERMFRPRSDDRGRLSRFAQEQEEVVHLREARVLASNP
jgi:hypothetical protein